MVPWMSGSRTLSTALFLIAAASCSRAPLRDGPGARPAGEGGAGVDGEDPRCGDGVVDPGEDCDDGNEDPSDGCDRSCHFTTCGNGVIDLGEECDDASQNRDAPALRIEHGDVTLPVLPVTTTESLISYYDYFSKSAHTGLEALNTSRAFLYFGKSTQQLGLVVVHGIDLDTSGIAQPESTVYSFIDGIPASAEIAIIDDDPDEFFPAGPGAVIGDWWFASNSDGGAIDALPFPGDWAITFGVEFTGGVDTWTYADGDGYDGETVFLPLEPDDPLTIISSTDASTCRRDCTVPRCGDGILDAGEVCDDRGAGGCSADCQFVL